MNWLKSLKLIRIKRGLSQTALAQRLGVTQSTVAQWESGAVMPMGIMIPNLADTLDCTIDSLYGREPPQATVAGQCLK